MAPRSIRTTPSEARKDTIQTSGAGPWPALDLTPTLVECLLIADDLTGACDAAVQFAARGRRAAVALAADAGASNPDMLAVSTESRGLSVEESRQAIMDVALRFADNRDAHPI